MQLLGYKVPAFAAVMGGEFAESLPFSDTGFSISDGYWSSL